MSFSIRVNSDGTTDLLQGAVIVARSADNQLSYPRLEVPMTIGTPLAWPAWATRCEITATGVAITGTGYPIVQIYDNAVAKVSGYTESGMFVVSTAANNTSGVRAGFSCTTIDALNATSSALTSGTIKLVKRGLTVYGVGDSIRGDGGMFFARGTAQLTTSLTGIRILSGGTGGTMTGTFTAVFE